jgi:hypothetical protein
MPAPELWFHAVEGEGDERDRCVCTSYTSLASAEEHVAKMATVSYPGRRIYILRGVLVKSCVSTKVDWRDEDDADKGSTAT